MTQVSLSKWEAGNGPHSERRERGADKCVLVLWGLCSLMPGRIQRTGVQSPGVKGDPVVAGSTGQRRRESQSGRGTN